MAEETKGNIPTGIPVVNPFLYIAPTGESVETIKELRNKCDELCNFIIGSISSSRERSLAITKLEEVSMWANKAIVFNQK